MFGGFGWIWGLRLGLERLKFEIEQLKRADSKNKLTKDGWFSEQIMYLGHELCVLPIRNLQEHPKYRCIMGFG